MSNSGIPPSDLPPVVVQGSLVNSRKSGAPQPTQTLASSYAPYETKKSQDYEKSPQYPLETAQELWALPPGWIVSVHESDGRLFYLEVATGRRSWVHPMANQSNNSTIMERDGLDRRKSLLDTPMNAARRPDNHQCCACFSLLACLPMGICAMFHSYKVDQAWKMGNYGDAVNHSRQAHNYACWGSVIGIVLLLFWFFRNHEFDFPDWSFGG